MPLLKGQNEILKTCNPDILKFNIAKNFILGQLLEELNSLTLHFF